MAEPTNLYDWIAIKNIDDEDFTFEVEGSPYQIEKNDTRYFPRFMAALAVKKLVTKILNKRDPQGRAVSNIKKRQEVASQIIVEERPMATPIKKTQDQINHELVEKMNSSDLDSVLKRRKSDLRSKDPNKNLIEPPEVVPPEVKLPEKKEPKVSKNKVKPTETNEDGPSKLPGEITDTNKVKFKVPDRKELMRYAKNDLKLDLSDKKTIAEFKKMSDEDLAIELQYPMEEDNG